jgi:hypothetical protein
MVDNKDDSRIREGKSNVQLCPRGVKSVSNEPLGVLDREGDKWNPDDQTSALLQTTVESATITSYCGHLAASFVITTPTIEVTQVFPSPLLFLP